jgi:hypothetical protein
MVDRRRAVGHSLLPGCRLSDAKDVVMTGGIGHFKPRNNAEIVLRAKVWIGREGVVVGDGEKAQTFVPRQRSQLGWSQRAV